MNGNLGEMGTQKIGVGNLNSGDGPSCSALVRNGRIKDVNEKGSGDGDGGFRVGDFVWAKIKSHPWFPGQVYDPRDASEFALKHSLADHLLVGFFGDGSCSWCLPSQLVHFVENFKEMSHDGTSRGFVKAVQCAVDDVGRIGEFKMTCKCIPLQIRDGLTRPVLSNVGVKEGVLAPEVDINRLSMPDYKPDEILSEVMHLAKAVLIDNELEFAVLRSWLSAFYRAKGGYRLSTFYECLCVEGMEEKTNMNEFSNDFSSPNEVPILRSQNDGLSSGDKTYHRKKRKSIAELMGKHDEVEPKTKKRDMVKEGKDVRVVNGAEQKKSEAADHENTSGKSKEEPKKLSAPRARKKSKYLCPPYTSPTWRIRNSSSKSDIEYEKISEVSQVDNNSKKASGDPWVTAPVSESADEAFDDILPDGHLKGLDASVNMNPTTGKIDTRMPFADSDVDVPVNKFLSELESAAVDPPSLSRLGSLDMVMKFAAAFRFTTYLLGQDSKVLQKCKTGKKRKSFLYREGNQDNSLGQGDAKSDLKRPKVVKTGRKPDSSRSKKAADISIKRHNLENLDGNASSCLILTFSPEFPLPSKEEIMRLFNKFGVLNEKETKLAMDSHSVRVAYMIDSDAAAAFKSLINKRPFGIKNVVNYSLQCSVAGSHMENSSYKQAPENPGIPQSTADDVLFSDVRVIRQKLDILTATLENYHPKVSQDDESSLKHAMKKLLENVETLSEKVRNMAENSSS